MNTILWFIGGFIGSFFGLLLWMLYRDPSKRDTAGLIRDFRAMFGSRETLTVLIAMNDEEISALRACNVRLPRGLTRDGKLFALKATVPELIDLHQIVMQLAQQRINRAARRQQSCLNGQTLALGTLAGHLHQLLLTHCATMSPPEPVSIALASGSEMPENAR